MSKSERVLLGAAILFFGAIAAVMVGALLVELYGPGGVFAE